MTSTMLAHQKRILAQWSSSHKYSPKHVSLDASSPLGDEGAGANSHLTILGYPLPHTKFTPAQTYMILASMVFFFTLIYGALQELVIVKIFDRKLSFFLANVQVSECDVFSAMYSARCT